MTMQHVSSSTVAILLRAVPLRAVVLLATARTQSTTIPATGRRPVVSCIRGALLYDSSGTGPGTVPMLAARVALPLPHDALVGGSLSHPEQQFGGTTAFLLPGAAGAGASPARSDASHRTSASARDLPSTADRTRSTAPAVIGRLRARADFALRSRNNSACVPSCGFAASVVSLSAPPLSRRASPRASGRGLC